jgi:hypothetical protein
VNQWLLTLFGLFRIAQLELETAQHERAQQRRIDQTVTSLKQCIILDEEEEVIDEYPQLTDHQLQVIRFALSGGARGDVSPTISVISLAKLTIFNFPGPRQQVQYEHHSARPQHSRWSELAQR